MGKDKTIETFIKVLSKYAKKYRLNDTQQQAITYAWGVNP
jgi:hypothetical protein